ncbi:helix-turn-helix domain-containing protein [Actinacidiphila acidipaludis]|uniref:Helix-turn-helix domain-containing protein n=1 Tax=Actinacidiphila acidipaludis TaxID=2873382 RepID=A0ABS7QD35_9ACTN|nr:helix-turn-helix domain-containing protein [Streptomyces acidipaludis]MBY8880878.1 helix-turn-helix domain-containing protein [Streptomyces acidipaludis]
MLRLVFTTEDLARVRVAPGPHPLWELVLATTLLGGSQGPAVFGPWRRQARLDLAALPIWQPRLLRALAPPRGDFPDFLTPAQGAAGLEEGIDAVLSAPRRRLRAELRCLPQLPGWAGPLAEGDREVLHALGQTLRDCYAVLVAPYAERVAAHIDSDRATRARDFLADGGEGLLAGLGPTMRWRAPVLDVDYPVRRDLHLAGRGLLLVPSVFCWRMPVTLIDPELPPVLVYPVTREAGWWAAQHGGRAASLEALIGRRRAACLRHLDEGCTTSELARRIGSGAAAASQHAAVLREAGLIASARRRNSVLHTLTPLGRALLAQNPSRAARWTRPTR